MVTSAFALVAAIVVSPVRAGPGAAASPPLDIWAAARAIRRERPLGLVTMGYLGRMWELYALWAWLALFFAAARQAATGMVPSVAETGPVTFLAIGVAGLVGAVVAGRLADRIGRTTVTNGAMLLSGACCLASPLVFTAATPVLVGMLLVWGAAVIADSAQFSTAVTELAEPKYAGSILALQLAADRAHHRDHQASAAHSRRRRVALRDASPRRRPPARRGGHAPAPDLTGRPPTRRRAQMTASTAVTRAVQAALRV